MISFCKYLIIFIILFLIYSEIKATDSLFKVTILDNPSPGYLRFDWNSQNNFFLLDNYGIPQYSAKLKGESQYFKLLKNGYWISMDNEVSYIYDQNLELVDSIPHCQKYLYDFHEVELLSNGHYLLLYIETVLKDLSDIAEGGQKDALLRSGVLVETDRSGKIYWEWKANDHINITEVTSNIDLTVNIIDFTHINSFVEDIDGNIIVSFRHLDEIIKIDKISGNIIWRMGGSASKNNEFSFINDDVNGFKGFSHQHSISLLPKGNLLMYDNGNLKDYQYSRAVEYKIDQNKKTAEKIWEYRFTPDIFQPIMGSVYRMPNGNTLINGGDQKIVEVTPDKKIALSIDYSSSDQKNIYRVFKVISKMNAVSNNISHIGNYSFNDSLYITGMNLNVNCLVGDGIVTIEKHNYSPQEALYNDSLITFIFPYRWVLSHSGISKITGTLKLKFNSIEYLGNINKLVLLYRNKEAFYTKEFKDLITKYDSTSDEITADFSELGEFVLGTFELSAPILNSPLNNSTQISLNGSVKWEKIKAANKYQLQISSNSSFVNPIVDIFSDSLQYIYKYLKFNTNYFWRVRALNLKDTSDWSVINMFLTIRQILPPELVYPPNSYNEFPIIDTLKWNKINGSCFYWLQLSINENFSDPIIDQKNILDSYQLIKNLNYNTKYYWRIKSYNLTDTSNWSEIWNFTTMENPELISPKLYLPLNNSMNLNSGTLIWQKVNNNSKYLVQISENPLFVDNILDTLILEDTTLKYNELEYNKDYYWRVKAYNFIDSSHWSEIWKFNVLPKDGVVILINPKYDEIQVPIKGILNWIKINGIEQYKLQISESSEFIQTNCNEINIDVNYYEYSHLKQNTQYFWRVTYIKDQTTGKWSDIWTFTTEAADSLPSPILINPDNEICSMPVEGLLNWYSVTHSDNYIVSISDNANFLNSILRNNQITDTICNYKTLLYEHKYYWRVAAENSLAKSKWSEIRSFLTALQPPTILYPPEHASDQPINGKIIWVENNAEILYHFQVALDSLFENIVIDSTLNSKSDYSYKLSEKTTYYFRIKSLNNNNQSKWSNILIFTTGISSSVIKNIKYEMKSLYPNPATDKIQFFDSKYIGSEYSIYSLSGKLMDNGKIEQNSINITRFPTGMYYIKIGDTFLFFIKKPN